MLTRDDLARLTPSERALYEHAGPLDRPFVEEDLRRRLARRPAAATPPPREPAAQRPRDPALRNPAPRDLLFDPPPPAARPAPVIAHQTAAPQPAAYQPSESKYRVARFVIAVEDFIAKALLVIGALWFLWSAYSVITSLQELSRYGASVNLGNVLGLLSLGALLPSLGMVVAAIIIFAHGQMLRATLDTADDMRELLAVTKAAAGRRRPNGAG